MADLSTFISQEFGSVVAAGAALLAIPGVIVAGAIQGRRALQGAEAQAKAALEAAKEQARAALQAADAQANKALEAAQEQARATIEAGRQQVEATLAGIRETSREAHAQWQRDRCQEVWADYVKELDVLLAKDQGPAEESETEGVLKAFAMVELISPAGVLGAANTAREDAQRYGLNLFLSHQNDRSVVNLWEAQRQLRSTVEDGANIVLNDGMTMEYVDEPTGTVTLTAASHEADVDMRTRHRRGLAARAALDALDAAERDREVEAAGEHARQALLDAGFSAWDASALATTVQRDHGEVQRLLEAERVRLSVSRDAFVEEARRELDALGR
ncbi:hypothetical protein ACIA8H_12885 [Streptomyces goshikiensis]|uniref:hypothetical protein n=1 Tax=Streptomyces goshikiensis TaxID=1942 RepID=UPI0037945E82